jgi:hypothetical protein
VNAVVNIGDARVAPGDLLRGDADGVVVLPRARGGDSRCGGGDDARAADSRRGCRGQDATEARHSSDIIGCKRGSRSAFRDGLAAAPHHPPRGGSGAADRGSGLAPPANRADLLCVSVGRRLRIANARGRRVLHMQLHSYSRTGRYSGLPESIISQFDSFDGIRGSRC